MPAKRQQLVRATQPYKIFMGAQASMAPAFFLVVLLHTYTAIYRVLGIPMLSYQGLSMF